MPPAHMAGVVSTQLDGSRKDYTQMDFEFGEEEKSNKIFTVKEAQPPSDFEAPYSQLPSSVKLAIVKQQVKNVYERIAERKKKEKNQLKQDMLAKAQMASRRAQHRRSNTLAISNIS